MDLNTKCIVLYSPVVYPDASEALKLWLMRESDHSIHFRDWFNNLNSLSQLKVLIHIAYPSPTYLSLK